MASTLAHDQVAESGTGYLQVGPAMAARSAVRRVCSILADNLSSHAEQADLGRCSRADAAAAVAHACCGRSPPASAGGILAWPPLPAFPATGAPASECSGPV